MRKIELTREIWQEGKMYSACCHELDVATAGRTVNEARVNLAEALEIFIEETARKGTLQSLLEEAGFAVEKGGEDRPRLPRGPAWGRLKDRKSL
ncbi:MAG: hypothetical protein Q7R39_11565 [Dehalococcoidia bacterium]|nr:hypothetical protein [Dehalococcoidia bacterium]